MANKKLIYTEDEKRVVLEAYALHGTYKAAGKALQKFSELEADQTINAREIVLAYRYDPKYADIFVGKQAEFKDLALSVAEKGMRLMDMRLDLAMHYEAKIQKIIKEIHTDVDIDKEDKKKVIENLKILKLEKLGEIATTAGIAYDKHRLASGDSTDNSTIKISYEGGDMSEFGN